MANTFDAKQYAQNFSSIASMPLPTEPPTSWLAELEETLLKVTDAVPGLKKPCQAFGDARQKVWPRDITPANWQKLQKAAGDIASVLKTMGSRKIELCQRPTRWGICRRGLDAKGNCFAGWHSD